MSALAVLAEGPGWLVIAKPPRLLVHRDAFSSKRAPAALQILRDQLGARVHPVHRLDFQASGCLLFALDRATTAKLQAAMRAPTARKRYLALVRGRAVGPSPIVVDSPMKDDTGVEKDARTEVWCLGASAEPRCSLLLAEPRTGRFHQVRRHVRDLSHPVIGDTKHGDSRVNREWRERHGVDRLALHALSLDLPDVGVHAVCPLFADHAALWPTLPLWADAVAACPDLARPALGSLEAA